MKFKLLKPIHCAVMLLFGTPLIMASEEYSTKLVDVVVETLATGLDRPWGVEILPDGALIVTERSGQIRIVRDGEISDPVEGVPPVVAKGQGGLLDIALANDFEESGEIYFTYSQPGEGGSGTAIARANLVQSDSKFRLNDVSVIYSMSKKSDSERHFGSRIAVGADGSLFVTVGDRGDADRAQDYGDSAGAVLRIGRDGGIPADNPYVADNSKMSEIWSKGHRNQQGMDIDKNTGILYTVEHGARGGDEINQPLPGKNYGWPIISYGTHYWGGKIGVGTEATGLEQPIHYWDPSIAPGGMVVYRGEMFPEWDGDFLVTALKDQMLVRVDRDATGVVTGEENMFQRIYGRMREVIVAGDGSLLILTDESNGKILRVAR